MKKFAFILISIPLLFIACQPDVAEPDPATYDPTPYTFTAGDFPQPTLPADNKLTNAGVQLGRMLFYEQKLSRTLTQSCADCHLQKDGFSDIRRFSLGVKDLPGTRQAMAVFNLAWHTNGFFWDGRAPLLRDQALLPIQDPLEMDETLENVVSKLQAENIYLDQFIRAFGDDSISAKRISLALEQFMMTIVSNQSKYDRFLRGEVALSPEEQRGFELFFAEFDPFGTERGGECFHCHAGINFTNNKFMNNGLDTDAEFTDEGRFKVTQDPDDMAKFKVPSLRNIALTPPFMHDGRFETLEAVLDHYNSGAKSSSTVDHIMQFNIQPGGLQLSVQDKTDIIAFLHTLTDTKFVNNEAYQSPF